MTARDDDIEDALIVDTDDESFAQEDSALDALLTELGGQDNVIVNVYRQPGHGRQRMSYCFCCSPGDYTLGGLLDKIRDEYGAGDYRIHIRNDNKILANKPISIEASRKAPPPIHGVQPAPAQSENMLMMFEKIIDQQNQAMERMIAAVQSRPQDNPMDLIERLVGLKALFKSDSPPRTDPLDSLKTLMEMQSLLETNKDNANTNDVLISLINQFMPQLAEMGKREQEIELKRVAMGRNVTAGHRRQSQAKPQPAPAAQQQSSNEVNPMRNNLIFLCGMAKRDVDPEPYAQLVLDQTDDEQLDVLIDFIKRDDVIEEMAKVYAPVAEYAGWFRELVAAILESVIDDEDEKSIKPSEAPQAPPQGPHKVPQGQSLTSPKTTSIEQVVDNQTGNKSAMPTAASNVQVNDDPRRKKGNPGHAKDNEGASKPRQKNASRSRAGGKSH